MSDLFTHGYAVVIGMGADLPVTITDAQGVATLLRDPSRCAYPSEQLQLLTGPDARRGDVLKALDQLTIQVKADPDATAVVYFSGTAPRRPATTSCPMATTLRTCPVRRSLARSSPISCAPSRPASC